MARYSAQGAGTHGTREISSVRINRVGLFPGEELRVYAFYRPPGGMLNTSHTRRLLCTESPTTIVGKLNAKRQTWSSRVANTAWNTLYRDAEGSGYEVIGPDSSTHIPVQRDHTADVLDVAIVHDRVPIHFETPCDMDTQSLPLPLILGTAPTRRALPTS